MRGGTTDLIAGVTPEPIDVDAGVNLYRLNNGADVYILANANLIANEDSSYTFHSFESVTKFTFNNFDVSNAVNMSYFFANCEAISSTTNLGINQLQNTKVTNLSHFLYYCSKLKSFIWPSTIDASHVTDFSYCFSYACMASGYGAVNPIKLSNLDTSTAVNMEGMFAGYAYNTYVGSSVTLSSKFNTKNVKNMSYMFDGASVKYSDVLKYLDTSSCTNMSYMFRNGGCDPNEKYIRFTNYRMFDTSKVIDMSRMFYNGQFVEIDISTFNFQSCKTVYVMFFTTYSGCRVYVNSDWWPLPSSIDQTSMLSSNCTVYTK